MIITVLIILCKALGIYTVGVFTTYFVLCLNKKHIEFDKSEAAAMWFLFVPIMLIYGIIVGTKYFFRTCFHKISDFADSLNNRIEPHDRDQSR